MGVHTHQHTVGDKAGSLKYSDAKFLHRTVSADHTAKSARTTSEMLECKICDYSTDDISVYNRHIQTHTSDTESVDSVAKMAVTTGEMLEFKTYDHPTDDVSKHNKHLQTHTNDTSTPTTSQEMEGITNPPIDVSTNKGEDFTDSADVKMDIGINQCEYLTDSVSQSQHFLNLEKRLQSMVSDDSPTDTGNKGGECLANSANQTAALVPKAGDCAEMSEMPGDAVKLEAAIHPTNLPSHDTTQPPLIKCTYCPHSTASSEELREHEALIHAEEKRLHPCPQCGLTYYSLQFLKKHQTIHTGEEPFACIQCDRRFITTTSLMAHMVAHKRKPSYHKCTVCGLKCKTTRVLKRHMLLHTKQKKYICRKCGNELGYELPVGLTNHSCNYMIVNVPDVESSRLTTNMDANERECLSIVNLPPDLPVNAMACKAEAIAVSELKMDAVPNEGQVVSADSLMSAPSGGNVGLENQTKFPHYTSTQTTKDPILYYCPQCGKDFKHKTKLNVIREHMVACAHKKEMSSCKAGTISKSEENAVPSGIATKTTLGNIDVRGKELNNLDLTPWLMERLESEEIPGLRWLDDDKKSFRLPWKFYSVPYSLALHRIYIEWAKHCGVSTKQTEELSTDNWRKMKMCLMAAISNHPDLQEEFHKGNAKDSFRVFSFRNPDEDVARPLRDRSQEYPGPLCQEMGIRQYDLLCCRLPTQSKKFYCCNGLVLEFYDFWFKRRQRKGILQDLLRLIIRGDIIPGVIRYVEYLRERKRNLSACGAIDQAEELLQMPFSVFRFKLAAACAVLDAIYPEMYIGPKVANCQVNIPAKENFREYAYFGPYTKEQNITKLKVIAGKLHTETNLQITNGIIFELYQYWGKQKAPKAVLFLWLAGIFPKRDVPVSEDKLFSKIEELFEFSQELGKSGAWCALENMLKGLFEPTEDGLSVEVKIKFLSVRSPQSVTSPKALTTTPGMTSFWCKEPACHCRVKHKVGSKSQSVLKMLCYHHRCMERQMEASHRRKQEQTEQKKKSKPRTLRTTMIKPLQQQYSTGHIYPSYQHFNYHTMPYVHEVCAICNAMPESIRHINIDTVIIGSSWRPVDGMTVRTRLQQALRGTAISSNWLCSTCYSTLVQLEESQQHLALFRGHFEQSAPYQSSLPTGVNCISQNQPQFSDIRMHEQMNETNLFRTICNSDKGASHPHQQNHQYATVSNAGGTWPHLALRVKQEPSYEQPYVEHQLLGSDQHGEHLEVQEKHIKNGINEEVSMEEERHGNELTGEVRVKTDRLLNFNDDMETEQYGPALSYLCDTLMEDVVQAFDAP